MPAQSKHYPPISDLINRDLIPGEVALLEDAIDDLLKEVRYRELTLNTSSFDAVRFYALTLVVKELRTGLLGTGIELVFFPGLGASHIPISFDYRWEILRYVNDFKAQGFAHSTQAFFELLLELAGISESEFLDGIIEVLIDDPDPYQLLVQEVKNMLQAYGSNQIDIKDPNGEIQNQLAAIQGKLTTLVGELQGGTIPLSEKVNHTVTAFETIGEDLSIDFDVFQMAFESIMQNLANPEERITRLIELFRTWLGGFSLKDLEDLLLPKAALALTDIDLALDFPRAWLQPIDPATNDIDTDPTKQSRLSFQVGSLEYSTQTGFHFQGEKSFSFTKSVIGKTGLTLEINDMRLDLSRKTNIPQATADGRPVDFMGVYAQEAVIGLPEKWFGADNGATLGIFGRNLLIGTGGISGTIGLEALAAPGTPSNGVDELTFTLGKAPAGGGTRKGFKIGFSHFHMLWQQNALIESSVKGSLTIPKFKQCMQDAAGNWSSTSAELRIDIEGLFERDGDFQITAKAAGGVSFCLDSVFIVTVDSLQVGKDDDRAFLCISGALRFDNNDKLKDIISDPIEVKKMCIYSDGSFQFEGGSLPLPDSAKLKLGPAEVFITNLTFGSEEREHQGINRKYKYFGFDCGISAGNAGLDLRADGVAFYFSVDQNNTNGYSSHRFLKIAGIGVDLIIPGNASKESAAVLIQGYLSLREEKYEGSIKFQMPKAKIAGGASMAMEPKKKAWVVDAFLELAVPIPLGPSGLGIYGFRAMIGQRYIAAKEAIGLTEDDRWFDYYKKDEQPDGKGVHIGKMFTPDETEGASNPFSIGAGLSLATTADEGKSFSIQAFFLLSLPNLIFIQGKANILGDRRVGLTEDEPPYFAFVAFEPGHSVEFGLGANYKQRASGGLLTINAEVEAAFFMRNSSAWYVNFGTKAKPITARIASLFNAYSYLMLSASGIEAGAGVRYGFKKKYGPVKAEVGVYLDIWGTLSFQGAQIGAGIALGGKVDVSVFGIGLSIGIATTLECTVPRPFRIAGTVEVCVAVKLLIKKFEKCFDVEFVWSKNDNRDDTPLLPMPTAAISAGTQGSPVAAVHIASGNTYNLDYFGNSQPAESDISAIIPLDTFVDIQFEKAVNANDVSDKIGGVTNAPKGNKDLIPPKPAYKRVTHTYSVKEVHIKIWNGSSWVDYHPYEALTVGSGAATAGINLSDLKLGFFQKTGKEYNKIRFLAQTPLSYMDTSAGGYVPEQMGITSSTLFCKDTERTRHCVHWDELTTYSQELWHYYEGLTLAFQAKDGQVVDFPNPHNIPRSLCISQGGQLHINLPEASLDVSMKLHSFATQVKVRFFAADRNQTGSFVQYVEVQQEVRSSSQLFQPVTYLSATDPIEKITIEPVAIDPAAIFALELQIDDIQEQIYQAASGGNMALSEELHAQLAAIKEELANLQSELCPPVDPNTGTGGGIDINEEIAQCTAQLQICQQQLDELTTQQDTVCDQCKAVKKNTKDCLRKIKDNFNQPRVLACVENIQLQLEENDLQTDELSTLLTELTQDLNGSGAKTQHDLVELQTSLSTKLKACHERCKELKEQVKSKQEECQTLQQKIEQLLAFLENAGGHTPPAEGCLCGTYLHEICWLTEEDVYFNQNIPGQAAVEEDFQLAQAAIQHIISPIWRPGAAYMVHLKVADKVDSSTHTSDVYFGFRTKGPIGHFPETQVANKEVSLPGSGSPPTNPRYDTKVEAPETSLKFYLDYEKSFPNPSGNILNAKPLYYKHPQLSLYYVKPYVYHFFGTWNSYQGLPQVNGHLEMRIKDPLEDMADTLSTDHTSAVFSLFPDTTVSWDVDDDPIIPEDVTVYDSLRNPEHNDPAYPGATCWTSGGAPIKPASKKTTIIPQHLKPLKLYTAIVLNNYEGTAREVHRYGFQTSRFGDFSEHINSYHLKDEEGNTRDAVFTRSVDLQRTVSAQTNINLAFNIVVNQPAGLSNHNKNLAETYADPYQRLMEGHFRLEPIHPSQGLTFDFLQESHTTKVIALIISSVEPLNDPRIPFDQVRNTIRVLENGAYRYDYFPLFSKDRTKVVLMNSSRKITANDVRVHFQYLEWDGQQYVVAAEKITDNLIL